MFENEKGGQTEQVVETAEPVLTKPSRSYLWAAVIIVVAGVLMGGGAFAYYKFLGNDEIYFQKALENTEKIKSFEYQGEFKITGNSSKASAFSTSLLGGRGDLDMLIEFKGSSDVTDVTNPKTRIKVDATLMDATRPMSVSIEALKIGEVNYLNLEGLATTLLSVIGESEGAGGFFRKLDLRPIQENWIKIDTAELRNKLGLKEIYEQKLQEAKEKELTKDQIEKLQKAFYKEKVIKIVSKLGKQTVGGVETRGFQVTVDQEGLKRFLATYEQVAGEKIPADLQKSVESASDISNMDVRIWVDKSGLFRKITFTFSHSEVYSSSVRFTGEMFFSNYNQAVVINAPQNIIDLNVLLEQLMGSYGLGSGFSTSSFDYRTSSPYYKIGASSTGELYLDSDKDGLSDYEEAIYDTDPKKADTDGDGFTDGEEIAKGYNPLGAGKLDVANIKSLRAKGYE